MGRGTCSPHGWTRVMMEVRGVGVKVSGTSQNHSESPHHPNPLFPCGVVALRASPVSSSASTPAINQDTPHASPDPIGGFG